MTILDPDVARYLAGHRPPPDPVLAEMEAHAERDGVPIVVPETGALLTTLALAAGARRVVEIGTAIGVSTLYLARALPDDGLLVSFEIDRARHEAAADYLRRAAVLGRVDLRLQDAREGLRSLAPPFDLAFLDAAKLEYDAYLDAVLPLLRPGGLVVIDNALLSGTVARGRPDAHWSPEHVARGRALLDRLRDDPALESTVLPVGDGVALAVVRPR